MSTLTKDNQDTLRLLVQHVSRTFYDPKFTVVMDQLVRHPVLKDDDLAGRMGLQLKELNKIMAVLENDRLVRIHRQNELKEGAQRSVGRQYFYIDYQHFCNVVKWRIAEMHRIIDSSLRNQLDNKGYICPQCKKQFSPLEADKVMDFAAGGFYCDVCHAELADNEDAESVRGSQDRMQRFNRQMRFIREGLRKTEDMVLPAFDVAAWIKAHILDSEKARESAQGGLRIAGTSGLAKQDDMIGIVLSVDKDDATQRMERDREAAAKRQQNLLPAWHLKSTISGDLTALGIKENAQRDDGAGLVPEVNKLPSSNDTIMKNLAATLAVPEDKEKKPAVAQADEADYYDQYYASLAASAAPSTQVTPSLPDVASDFGEEEEDVKPSLEYLSSLNEYRKRSRSREDVGGGSATPKMQKLNGLSQLNGVSSGAGGISTPVEQAPTAMPTTATITNGVSVEDVALEESLAPAADDPIVYVNGQPVAFSQITEEHQELMTPEEYTAYFELYSARS